MFQKQANQRDSRALVELVLTSSTLTQKGRSERGLGWGPGPWSAQQILYPMNLWQETEVPMNLWQETEVSGCLGWGPRPWSAQQTLYPMNLWQETGVPMNLWQETEVSKKQEFG